MVRVAASWLVRGSFEVVYEKTPLAYHIAVQPTDSVLVVPRRDEGPVIPVEPSIDPPAQEALFEGDFTPIPADLGFRGPIACQVAGITYRQLDYWARTGLVTPEVRGAGGSGTQRLYSYRDILILRVIKRLLDAGITLQQTRLAISHLRDHGVADLSRVTLMSDGVTVYECTSDMEVIDLLAGGQGMFAIALGRVCRDIEGTLIRLPSERAGATEDATASHQDTADDELAARRRSRQAG